MTLAPALPWFPGLRIQGEARWLSFARCCETLAIWRRGTEAEVSAFQGEVSSQGATLRTAPRGKEELIQACFAKQDKVHKQKMMDILPRPLQEGFGLWQESGGSG